MADNSISAVIVASSDDLVPEGALYLIPIPPELDGLVVPGKGSFDPATKGFIVPSGNLFLKGVTL
jgi:hypothetical protein